MGWGTSCGKVTKGNKKVYFSDFEHKNGCVSLETADLLSQQTCGYLLEDVARMNAQIGIWPSYVGTHHLS